MLNIKRLHQNIGPERCLALPMFHAMSGCDTTSGLKSRGKRIWWNTWNNHPEVTETFMKISQHPSRFCQVMTSLPWGILFVDSTTTHRLRLMSVFWEWTCSVKAVKTSSGFHQHRTHQFFTFSGLCTRHQSGTQDIGRFSQKRTQVHSAGMNPTTT